MKLIDLDQMHRLFTHEDAAFFHAHKILGVMVLGHFWYRLILVWKYGHMFFGPDPSTLFWIIVHASLHVTSFQFNIPKRRNRVYNIIWPEMRWHTAIFAWRSLALMLAMWLAERGVVHASILGAVVFRGALVLITMACADVATFVHGTNTIQSTTMRGNPYPRYASPAFITWNNLFYSASQVLATLNILSKTKMEVPFMILLPIQTAPLGMTLVKKGIITQAGWHLGYTLALLTNYVHAFINPGTQLIPRYMYWSVFMGFSLLRFRYRVNKYILWGCGIIILTCMYYNTNGLSYTSTSST